MKSLKLTSPIPNDTKKALKQHNWQIDNIALLLNKYLDFLLLEECNNIENDCFIKIREKLKTKNNLKIKGVNFLNKHYKIKRVLKNTAIKNINFFPIIRKEQIKNEDRILEKILDKNKEIGRLDNEFLYNLKKGLKTLRSKFIESNGSINKTLNSILEKLHDRQEKIVGKRNTIKLTTKSRLVVGLGSGSVLETSIKLHHIYGIPYIPASAIKGVLRAYKIWKLAEWNEERYKEIEKKLEENKDLSNEEKEIIKIFGNQQQKGELIFLDAYPDNFEGFDIDIMNNHFPNYYEGNEPPADWQNPNPITFLAIPENTGFIFYFKNSKEYEKVFGKNSENQLKKDLEDAFKTIGIGGKTALGYGLLG